MSSVIWNSIFTLVMLGLLALAGVIARANADEAQKAYELAVNNFQHEQTTCAAYFRIVGECNDISGFKKNASDYKKMSEHMVKLMFVTGQQAKLSQDAMLSRFDMEMKGMFKLMKNSCSNISSIMNRYMDRCELVAKEPSKVMSEYAMKALGGRR